MTRSVENIISHCRFPTKSNAPDNGLSATEVTSLPTFPTISILPVPKLDANVTADDMVNGSDKTCPEFGIPVIESKSDGNSGTGKHFDFGIKEFGSVTSGGVGNSASGSCTVLSCRDDMTFDSGIVFVNFGASRILTLGMTKFGAFVMQLGSGELIVDDTSVGDVDGKLFSVEGIIVYPGTVVGDPGSLSVAKETLFLTDNEFISLVEENMLILNKIMIL